MTTEHSSGATSQPAADMTKKGIKRRHDSADALVAGVEAKKVDLGGDKRREGAQALMDEPLFGKLVQGYTDYTEEQLAAETPPAGAKEMHQFANEFRQHLAQAVAGGSPEQRRHGSQEMRQRIAREKKEALQAGAEATTEEGKQAALNRLTLANAVEQDVGKLTKTPGFQKFRKEQRVFDADMKRKAVKGEYEADKEHVASASQALAEHGTERTDAAMQRTGKIADEVSGAADRAASLENMKDAAETERQQERKSAGKWAKAGLPLLLLGVLPGLVVLGVAAVKFAKAGKFKKEVDASIKENNKLSKTMLQEYQQALAIERSERGSESLERAGDQKAFAQAVKAEKASQKRAARANKALSGAEAYLERNSDVQAFSVDELSGVPSAENAAVQDEDQALAAATTAAAAAAPAYAGEYGPAPGLAAAPRAATPLAAPGDGVYMDMTTVAGAGAYEEASAALVAGGGVGPAAAVAAVPVYDSVAAVAPPPAAAAAAVPPPAAAVAAAADRSGEAYGYHGGDTLSAEEVRGAAAVLAAAAASSSALRDSVAADTTRADRGARCDDSRVARMAAVAPAAAAVARGSGLGGGADDVAAGAAVAADAGLSSASSSRSGSGRSS